MEVKSKSTDKLEIVSSMVGNLNNSLPPEKIDRLKLINIDWKSLDAGGDEKCMICPTCNIEFFE